jgi:hypothetical protein
MFYLGRILRLKTLTLSQAVEGNTEPHRGPVSSFKTRS